MLACSLLTQWQQLLGLRMPLWLLIQQVGNVGPTTQPFQQSRTLAETMLSEDSDVLFPQALAGPNGRYWVVYEKAGPNGSEIVLRDLTRELAAGGKYTHLPDLPLPSRGASNHDLTTLSGQRLLRTRGGASACQRISSGRAAPGEGSAANVNSRWFLHAGIMRDFHPA